MESQYEDHNKFIKIKPKVLFETDHLMNDSIDILNWIKELTSDILGDKEFIIK